MISTRDSLVGALLDPMSLARLDAGAWNDLLLRGRASGLLARLGAGLIDCGIIDVIPPKARAQIRGATISAESSQTSVRFEINRVLRALGPAQCPVILLKGAAYVMAGLPPARGRLVGDLDLMVPRARIELVEKALIASGWLAAELDAYDQRYYREWTHEIPPLQHPGRETPLDIHHTIVPVTSRVHPDADALFEASVPLADGRLRVLAPADMVLHSAVHLLNDEVGRPLRDLFDLHDLLSRFGSRPGFWDALVERARLHGLQRPCFYMLRYTERILGTAIPPEVSRVAGEWAPARALLAVMDRLFAERFRSTSLTPPGPATSIAGEAYYLRAHWLRMPLPMLARHLSVKVARRVRDRYRREPETADI